ncbi:MAG: undecaprenyl-diphosphate phosphatase [Candidatus Paceibacteria bacterium]
MSWLEAILLGFVQGFLEFLPVSSSGHLVLFRELFSISIADALAYDAVLHLATLLAVMVYFSKDLLVLLRTFLRILSRLPVNQKEVILMKSLIFATVPAAFVGYFFESIINVYFANALMVAAMLFVGALFFMYAEWRYVKEPRAGVLTVRHAWYIGLFQMCALLPGISRSGMTIGAGMLLGMTRRESASFSFLLAIPIIAGAGLKKSIDLLASPEPVQFGMLFAGAVVSFVVALIVIHMFMRFISTRTLWPFVWYAIMLAGLVGYVHFFA